MNADQPNLETARLMVAPESLAFAREVGPRGLYLSPTLQQRLDLIEHLIEFGRQIIVLSGNIDSGKSTLLNYFMDAQRASWYPIRIHAGPGLTAEGLLGLLVRDLGIASDAPDDQVSSDHVRQRIAVLERAGKVVVLLVDDAEQLLPETATMVVKLAHADDQFAELRVLLAADLDQSALLETLQRAHPQHGLVHLVEIPRLIDTQIQSLIEHRMRAVELDAADYFSADDYASITASADGRVGKVVTLARQHMAGISAPAAPQDPPRAGIAGLTRGHVNLVFGILAAAAIAVGAWWATRNPLELSSAQTETVELTPSSATSMAETDNLSSPATPPLTVESESEVPVSALAQDNDAGKGSPMQVPVAPIPLPEVARENPRPTVTAAPPVPAELPPPAATIAPEVVAPNPLLSNRGTASPAIAPKRKPQPAPAAAPPRVPAQVVIPRPAAPKLLAKTVAIKAPSVAIPAESSVKHFSADWLRKQPAGAHTLQLFGVRERSAAERYRVQHGIITQSAVLTSTLNGKPWYVVVYGYYPNRTAAVTAATRLSASLRDTKPWVRSIGSLRGALQ